MMQFDNKHNKHYDTTWIRIDKVVIMILKDQVFLERKGLKELEKIVMKKFGIKERMAAYYIAEAKKQVRAMGKEKAKKAFSKAIMDREYLFREAKEAEDYKAALEVVKDRDKIRGLYEEKVNVNHSGVVVLKDDIK